MSQLAAGPAVVTDAVGGVPPESMGIGPIAAIPMALKLAGLSLNDIDLIEWNGGDERL